MVPTNNEELLRFWDALTHDLGIFAAEHPELVRSDELAERRDVIALKQFVADLVASKPRPPRPPPPEPVIAVDTLPMDFVTIHEQATGDHDVLALLRAYRAGLTREEARANAGLSAGEYVLACERLHRIFDDVCGDS